VDAARADAVEHRCDAGLECRLVDIRQRRLDAAGLDGVERVRIDKASFTAPSDTLAFTAIVAASPSAATASVAAALVLDDAFFLLIWNPAH
jgi:hypothetical protein